MIIERISFERVNYGIVITYVMYKNSNDHKLNYKNDSLMEKYKKSWK